MKCFKIYHFILFVIIITSYGCSEKKNNFSLNVPKVAPKVEFIYPDSDDILPINSNIIVLFNKEVNSATISPSTFNVMNNNGQSLHGTLQPDTEDKRVVIFDIDTPLVENANYKIMLSDIEDFDGNKMIRYTDNFTTGAKSERNPYPIIKTKSIDKLQLRFNDTIDQPDILINQLTIDNNKFTIRQEGDSYEIKCTTKYDVSQNILNVFPFENLVYYDSQNQPIQYLLNIKANAVESIFNTFNNEHTIPFKLITGKKISADDGKYDNQFGNSVSVVGTGNQSVIVVGASHTNIDSNNNHGAAYIYMWDNILGEFQQTQQLIPTDGIAYGYFGNNVLMTNDKSTLFVGNENSLIGNTYQGAVHIFNWNYTLGEYEQNTQKLIASDSTGNDSFGQSMAVSHDNETLIIGAPCFDIDSKAASNHGAVYIFKWNNILGEYEQIHQLLAPPDECELGGKFGKSVAISGSGNETIIVVGAPGLKKIYIYKWNNINQEFEPIQNSIFKDIISFGSTVTTTSGTGNQSKIIVGAPNAEINGITGSGSAFIFQFDETNNIYEQTQQLYINNSASSSFGQSIAAYGTENQTKIVINDFGLDEIYIYGWNNNISEFEIIQTLKDDNNIVGDGFGSAIATSSDGSTIAIGARYDDVNYNRQGAVYLYYTY